MPKTHSSDPKAFPSAQKPRPPATSPPEGAQDFTIVAMGASAGGLEACTGMLAALVDGHGLAFILVQHLHPTHESMMVELLASHTSMTVQQAVHGMLIEPDHLYIIPPGTYLSVENGILHILRPHAPHGARLPFDFLLLSLAKEFGEWAVCVVLSGSGGDGSVGLMEIKARGGLVIVQDPAEAGYSGMPTSAIETGEVDLVLPLAGIADTLVTHGRRRTEVSPLVHSVPEPDVKCGPAEIIELLRVKTNHDFTLYKPGTLQRRITRRMAISGIESGDIGQYLALLRTNAQELDLLSKDLLINVTNFFRDPKVFEFLTQVVVPDLIRSKVVDQSLRIWIARRRSRQQMPASSCKSLLPMPIPM
jgi:two-component system CheB/CheR fusion protein